MTTSGSGSSVPADRSAHAGGGASARGGTDRAPPPGDGEHGLDAHVLCRGADSGTCTPAAGCSACRAGMGLWGRATRYMAGICMAHGLRLVASAGSFSLPRSCVLVVYIAVDTAVVRHAKGSGRGTHGAANPASRGCAQGHAALGSRGFLVGSFVLH